MIDAGWAREPIRVSEDDLLRMDASEIDELNRLIDTSAATGIEVWQVDDFRRGVQIMVRDRPSATSLPKRSS